jgi:ribosomal-protein-alanine N-acetyltransferase
VTTPEPFQLVTDRLLLRDFVDEDHHATNEYERDPIVVRYQGHGTRTLEESLAYIRRAIAESQLRPRRLYDLAVLLREEPRVVGRCGLSLGEGPNRDAALWYVLHPRLWGKGIIVEAARALVAYGFRELGLHRVWVDCDPENRGSARVAEKLGMRREAHMLENAWFDGRWVGTYIYAVLDREWPPPV